MNWSRIMRTQWINRLHQMARKKERANGQRTATDAKGARSLLLALVGERPLACGGMVRREKGSQVGTKERAAHERTVVMTREPS